MSLRVWMRFMPMGAVAWFARRYCERFEISRQTWAMPFKDVLILVPKPKEKNMTKAHCCQIDCKKPAEYVIYAENGKPDNDTHACAEHIGELLSDAYWHRIAPISEIEEAPAPESPSQGPDHGGTPGQEGSER